VTKLTIYITRARFSRLLRAPLVRHTSIPILRLLVVVVVVVAAAAAVAAAVIAVVVPEVSLLEVLAVLVMTTAVLLVEALLAILVRAAVLLAVLLKILAMPTVHIVVVVPHLVMVPHMTVPVPVTHVGRQLRHATIPTYALVPLTKPKLLLLSEPVAHRHIRHLVCHWREAAADATGGHTAYKVDGVIGRNLGRERGRFGGGLGAEETGGTARI